MVDRLLNKEAKLAVIGLGYVGLPIALEFARKISVIGFDINPKRIELMKQKIDPSNELPPEAFENTDILFTANPDDLKQAQVFIIAVPTPIDEHRVPDLKPLFSASRIVGKNLKKGDYVIYESTVYPGCTEEDCIPILEEESGLRYREDFKVGYSPERINPGDQQHTLPNIIKVVSGCDEEALNTVASIYEIVVKAGVFRASSIKVAEAAKIIENTQRDVNIALMNELSKIFAKMNIPTYDVLEAAATKWNFLKFYPGLVGGHCIGVDPYYLTYKAIELDYKPEVILSGRRINDSMGAYVARKLVQDIIKAGKYVMKSKVLIMGITFKENVSDIRNSKVVDIINELHSYSVNVDVYDPKADPQEVEEEYGIKLITKPEGGYDGIIVAVNHREFEQLDESYFKKLMPGDGILVDIRGIYRGKINHFKYWTL